MSIFLMLMLVPDIGRRTLRYAEERWLYAAEPRPAAAAPHEPGGDSAHDPDQNAAANGKAPAHGKPAEGKHGGHD
jgi:hypothetical protein